jgi:hypothetical protein
MSSEAKSSIEVCNSGIGGAKSITRKMDGDFGNLIGESRYEADRKSIDEANILKEEDIHPLSRDPMSNEGHNVVSAHREMG